MRQAVFGIFLTIIVCGLIASRFIVHASTNPRTWIVDARGNEEFTTIQAALNQANSGDTVYVKSGAYPEHLMISKPLSLLGENRETTIIDAQGKEPGSIAVIAANNVKIAGFTFQNTRGGGNAIWIEGFNESIVSDNLIATKSGDGIRVLRSYGNTISNNLLTNNSYTSIGFDWAHDNSVFNNTIMTNNIVIGASYDTYKNVFYNNTIAGNNYGILVAMHDSKFFHNILLNNTVQASVYFNLSNTWDNGYASGGNYWSDYDLTDSGDKDIGNKPYVINDNNKDNYPVLNIAYLERSTYSTDIDYSLLVSVIGGIGVIAIISGVVWRRRKIAKVL